MMSPNATSPAGSVSAGKNLPDPRFLGYEKAFHKSEVDASPNGLKAFVILTSKSAALQSLQQRSASAADGADATTAGHGATPVAGTGVQFSPSPLPGPDDGDIEESDCLEIPIVFVRKPLKHEIGAKHSHCLPSMGSHGQHSSAAHPAPPPAAEAVVAAAVEPAPHPVDAFGAPRYSAVYNLCPHKQGVMSLGDIEQAAGPPGSEGGCGGQAGSGAAGSEPAPLSCSVRCPRHRKKFAGGLYFNVDTGRAWVTDVPACMTKFDPDWQLPVFDVLMDGEGFLWVSREPKCGRLPDLDGAADTGAAAESAGEEAGAQKQKGKGADREATPGAVDAAADTNNSSARGMGMGVGMRVQVSPRPVSGGLLWERSPRTAPRSTPGGGEADDDVPFPHIPAVIAAATRVSHDSWVYRMVAPGAQEAQTDSEAPWPFAQWPEGVSRHSWHVHLALTRPAACASSASSHALPAVSREYTPVSTAADLLAGQGPFLDLLIKLYPGKGQLTSCLADGRVGVGSTVWISRPVTTLTVPSLRPPRSLQLSAAASPVLQTSDSPSAGGESEPVCAEIAPYNAGRSNSVSAAASASSSASAPLSLAYEQDGQPHAQPAVAMIAGGTGITPMVQLARWAVGARVPVYAVVSNHTPADALGMPEMRSIAAAAGRSGVLFRCLFTYTRINSSHSHSSSSSSNSNSSNPSSSNNSHHSDSKSSVSNSRGTDTHASESTGATTSAVDTPGVLRPDPENPSVFFHTAGRVDANMLRHFLPAPAPGALRRVVVSGPLGMGEAVQQALLTAGYDANLMVELEA
jgi:ferredoxin-NADP reductase